MRDTLLRLYYFKSIGEGALDHVPTIPASYGLQEQDLFIHTFRQNQHQIWRCISLSPLRWEALTQGHEYVLPDHPIPRTFVITEGGLPSWVCADTVERQYKRTRKAAI